MHQQMVTRCCRQVSSFRNGQLDHRRSWLARPLLRVHDSAQEVAPIFAHCRYDRPSFAETAVRQRLDRGGCCGQ